MEFLVEFELNVPEGTPESDVKQRESAEAAASADLAREGHLARLWKSPVPPGERKAVGLYRAVQRSAARRSPRRPAAQPLDADHCHAARAAPQRPD